VIYSMATSSHSDAPRGREFLLYSANRLNVATSRAMCLSLWLPALACLKRNAGHLVKCSWLMRFAAIWRWRARCDAV
jgi:hypothetical protein